MDVEEINPYRDDSRAKTEQVRDMFDAIAPAYDFMNGAMSFGLHRRWLAKTVRRVAERRPQQLLDVATGTADVALRLARVIPEARVTGIDLSEGMIAVGRKKIEKSGLSDRITLRQADCLSLPFDDNTFDCVTVAYGVRNFERLDDGYREMLRVLRPGGMIAVIELSTPRSRLERPFYRLYTKHIIPLVGRIVSKDVRAYSYLPESIAAVPQREAMTELMESVGFSQTAWKGFTMGVCCVYTAIKKV